MKIKIKSCDDCPFGDLPDFDAIDRGEESFCNYYELPIQCLDDLFFSWPEEGEIEKLFGNLTDDECEAYDEFFSSLEKPLFCALYEIIVKEHGGKT